MQLDRHFMQVALLRSVHFLRSFYLPLTKCFPLSFIAERVDPLIMLSILGTKVAIGMIMGFAIDGALRLKIHSRVKQEEEALQALGHGQECTHFHEGHHNHASEQHHHPVTCTCPHGHHLTGEELEQPFSHHHCHNPSCSVSEESSGWKDILLSAVKHTLQVTVIVYLISFVLVAAFELVGEDAITNFLASNPGIAIFGSALVGLIPNCGASVVITQLYLDGMLGTGAMLSGLLVYCRRRYFGTVQRKPSPSPEHLYSCWTVYCWCGMGKPV